MMLGVKYNDNINFIFRILASKNRIRDCLLRSRISSLVLSPHTVFPRPGVRGGSGNPILQ